MFARYQITERFDTDNPHHNDPIATLPHKGCMYDLRDTHSGNVICASARDLLRLRKLQAAWNSKNALASV